jgi:hypothetical protein
MTADAAPVPRFPVPGPEHPGWVDLRRAVTAATAAVTLAVEEMCQGQPGDDRRAEMAGLCAGVLRVLSDRVGTIVLDEAVIEELEARAAGREARAYQRGLAAGAAARRCGPHRNPGGLRAVSDG